MAFLKSDHTAIKIKYLTTLKKIDTTEIVYIIDTFYNVLNLLNDIYKSCGQVFVCGGGFIYDEFIHYHKINKINLKIYWNLIKNDYSCDNFINIEDLHHTFTSSLSTDFIKRFANKLEMNEKYIKYAIEISNNINKLDLASTHEPPSVAAGCLLLVINMYSLPINKKQISEVFSISDVTISKTYRRIWPFHKIITNTEITDMILEKKQSLPKQKININKDNLIMLKNNIDVEVDIETTDEEPTIIINKKSGISFMKTSHYIKMV
jgi:dihydrofolate reductase